VACADENLPRTWTFEFSVTTTEFFGAGFGDAGCVRGSAIASALRMRTVPSSTGEQVNRRPSHVVREWARCGNDASGGSAVPPGWAYNPSGWSQRIPIAVLALGGFVVAAILALFQVDVLRNVPEPFFGSGAAAF
jgi:hypothetical protein